MHSKIFCGIATGICCFLSSFAHSKNSNKSSSVAPPLRGGYIIGIRGGVGSSGWYFNISASVGFQLGTNNFNLNGFLSGSFHPGSQLGTFRGTRPFSYDVAGGAYVMAGKGTGIPRHFYTLNYNTPSPFPNVSDLSISWGQLVTYNYAINALGTGPGAQIQGFFGLRLGENFAASYHNNSREPPTWTRLLGGLLNINSTDAGWTGGLTMNIFDIEIVYENFSGYRGPLAPGAPLPTYYPQSPYDQSLNKASTFIQYDEFKLRNFARNSGFRFDYFTVAWLQDFIHNYISIEPRYRYTYQNRFNVGAGASKYTK